MELIGVIVGILTLGFLVFCGMAAVNMVYTRIFCRKLLLFLKHNQCEVWAELVRAPRYRYLRNSIPVFIGVLRAVKDADDPKVRLDADRMRSGLYSVLYSVIAAILCLLVLVLIPAGGLRLI